jgi:Bacterial transcriptional activator domain/NB-ARC domain
MLALHRAGRQAEALSAYARFRQIMVDELGQDPSASTRELHQRILRSDPTLMPASPTLAGGSPHEVRVSTRTAQITVDDVADHQVPVDTRRVARRLPPAAPLPHHDYTRICARQLPADTRIFAGRGVELEHLVALAHGEGRDRADPGTVVFSAINGMGGVGKTALAVRAAHRLAERYPDGQLFIDLHGYSAELNPVDPEDALDYLLRSLGVPPEAIPRDAGGRAALYRSKLAETRTLIVLDNAVSAAQVRPLLPGAKDCLVLVTSRNQLASLDDAHQLALDVLSGADAGALLHGVSGRGRIPESEAAELVGLCGHMPLAIRIVAARLRHRSALSARMLIGELREERGRLARLRDSERDLGTVFASSLRVLPECEQRLFRAPRSGPRP